MKKLQLISIDTYCSKAKCWSKDEMIIYHTQIEDLINHPFSPYEIPELNYPKSSLVESVGLYNFFRSNVSRIAP